MNSRRLLALLALASSSLVLAPAPLARGGDEESGEPATIDLSGFRAGAVAKAARSTWVPCDPTFAEQWSADEIGEDAKLVEFQEPPFADHAAGAEVVDELVRRLLPEATDEGWQQKVVKDQLFIWAPKEGVEKARAAIRYIEQAMAPRLAVRATLSAAKGIDGSSRLLAVGAVRLLPRRWTTVWLRTNVRRFTPYYELEIAQEVVANKPVVAALPEGEELHLRWSPGEKTSLIEVYASETAHRAPFEQDLSGIRNVPESNSPGAVQLPRTAVRRSLTAIALDASKPGVAEWTWDGPDGARTLRLSVDAAPAAPPDKTLNDAKHTALGVVRAGASAAQLESGGRDEELDDAITRFTNGAAAGARGVVTASKQAQAFLVCEGPKAQVERLRAQVEADDRRLAAAVVEMRSVAAPAAVLREDVETGRLSVGAVLDPAVATAYLRSPVHATARFPVTAGLRATFQSGASLVGLSRADVEVAQQAGGIYFSARARFDGLLGHATVLSSEGGLALRVSATVSWARADGSMLDLAFRRPYGMNDANGHPGGIDDPSVRRAPIAVEGHGSAAIEADVTFSPAEVAEGRWAVLAVALRPGASPEAPSEPLLVLGTVRR